MKIYLKNTVAMATHFSTLVKNLSCTSIYHYGSVYQISSQLVKNRGSSTCTCMFHKFYAWILFLKCCCHGNTFLDIDDKDALHFYIHCIIMDLHVCTLYQISNQLLKNWGSRMIHKFFCTNFISKMLLPWQRFSQLWQKILVSFTEI